METRANFVLIGLFTIAGLLAGLGFFIWLARAEFDRQYDYYDVLFESVSGLGPAAEVSFSGLPVGQVIDLALYEADPNLVRVRIEIDADTPVDAGTMAQLQAQGVTGVSVVALQAGAADAGPIEEFSIYGVPIIPSERSALQTLTEEAPDIVEEVGALLEDLRGFVSAENRDYVTRILDSLDRASSQLDIALEDFSAISQSVREGTSQITAFTGRLEQIGAAIETTLTEANQTLQVVRQTVAEAETTLLAGTEALNTATQTFGTAEAAIGDARGFIAEDLPRLSGEVSETIAVVQDAVEAVRDEVTQTLDGFGGTATLANARLAQIEATIALLDATLAEANATLAAVESASASFETLVEGEGTALVSDARGTLASVNDTLAALDSAIQEDLPTIVADVRAATATANRVIDEVGADVTAFTDRLGPLVEAGEDTLATATQTLQGASGTLDRLERSLDVADRTLTQAEAAFSSANAAIETDLAPALADIGDAAAQIEATMQAVAEDLPEVTEGLRATVARAQEAVAQIEAAVAASAPGVESFATDGLAQFTRFARQGQDLLTRLDRLTQQIERDPTRFFFGGNPSEFRR